MAEATTSATAGFSGSPLSIVFFSDLKTSLGSLAFIAERLKTLLAKSASGDSSMETKGATAWLAMSATACLRTLVPVMTVVFLFLYLGVCRGGLQGPSGEVL